MFDKRFTLRAAIKPSNETESENLYLAKYVLTNIIGTQT